MGDDAIPLAQIERIMRNAGAEHISSIAIELLRESTAELGNDLAAEAVQIARQNGHDRVERSDIKEAVSS